jgi:hypothetical protein
MARIWAPERSGYLPPPEVIAQEIVEDLEAALEAASLDRG